MWVLPAVCVTEDSGSQRVDGHMTRTQPPSSVGHVTEFGPLPDSKENLCKALGVVAYACSPSSGDGEDQGFKASLGDMRLRLKRKLLTRGLGVWLSQQDACLACMKG